MNELLKDKKLLVYIILPAVAALWFLYSALYSLPMQNKKWQEKVKIDQQYRPLLKEIITLAPEKVVAGQDKGEDFDFDKAIDKTAKLCAIDTSQITPNIRGRTRQGNQFVQDAVVSIDQVGVRQFSMFLAVSLNLWTDLQCERLKLIRIPGPKDKWKADINFKYFY